MEVSGQINAPAALSPWKKPNLTHWFGSSVDTRAGLDAVAKKKKTAPA